MGISEFGKSTSLDNSLQYDKTLLFQLMEGLLYVRTAMLQVCCNVKDKSKSMKGYVLKQNGYQSWKRVLKNK